MNKTFKVARSLTRGTVVTSEKASSYQGKAVKTVIAAAVASLVAGTAMAADTPATTVNNVTITGANSTLTITASDNSANTLGVSGTVTTTADGKTTAVTDKNTLGATPSITFTDGGKLVVTGTKDNASNVSLGAITLNGTADNTPVIVLQTAGTTTSDAAKGTTVSTTSNSLTKAVLSFEKAATQDDKQALEAKFTLGTDDATLGGEEGEVVAINVADGVKGTVAAADTKKLTLANVDFNNLGTLELSASGVNFNSAYDQTAEGNTGKLIVDGVATINNAFTATSTYVGEFGKDANGKDETAAVQFKKTVTVDGTTGEGVYTADSLTVNLADGFKVVSGGQAVVGTVDLKSGSATVGGSLKDNLTQVVTPASLTVTTLKTAANTTLTVGKDTGDNTEGLVVLTGADSVNAGTITVNSESTEDATYGLVIAEGAQLTNNATVSGSGSVTVAGKLVNAAVDDKATTGGTIGNASTAEGKLVVASTGSVTNDAKSTINVESLTVAAGGTVENTGFVGAETLDLTGTLTTNLSKGGEGKAQAFHFDTIKLQNGAVLNVVTDETNDKTLVANFFDKETTTLKIHDGQWELNGGDVQLDGTTLRGSEYNVEVGNGGAGKTVLDVTFGADYEFGNVTVADKTSQQVTLTATDGANLTLKDVDLSKATVKAELKVQSGASVTVEDVTLGTSGSASVTDGSLTVAGTLNATEAGSVVLNADGELTVDVAGLYKDGKYTTSTDNEKYVKPNAITANNGSSVTITGLDGESFTTGDSGTLKNITGLISGAGQINLGNITLKKDADTALITDGKVAYSDVKDLANIVVDELASSTVTKVSGAGFTHGGTFGALQMEKDENVSVQENTTLQLNGTGDLVTYTDKDSGKVSLKNVSIASGGIFTVGGEGEAAIGSVTKTTGANGTTFNILEGKTLAVNGDVDVATMNADGTTTVKGAVTADTLKVNGTTLIDTTIAATPENPNPTQNEVTLGTLTVSETGSFAVTGKTTISQSGTVYGTASFGQLSGSLSVGSDATDVLPEGANGHATIGELLGTSSVTFDPAFDAETQTLALEKASTGAVLASEAGAATNVNRGAVVGIGAGASEAEAVAAFAATGWGLGQRDIEQADGSVLNKDAQLVTSVVAVNTLNAETQKHETFGGQLYVGLDDNLSQLTLEGVAFAKDSMLIVDATKVDTTGATQIFGQTIVFDDGAELVLTNVGNGDKIAVGEFEDSESSKNFSSKLEDLAFTGDVLMEAGLVTDKTTEVASITVGMIKKSEIVDVLGDVPGLDAAYDMFATRANLGNSSSVEFNNWLYTSTNQPTYQGIRNAAKDVAGLGATTGVQTLTMDAVNQMADTVADRTSILTQRGQGVNVWADVNGGKFEAKKLFDGAGYSSDIYSGVLGLDYQFSCNAVLGAALTIGTADTDTKNSGVNASTDSDLVGFSVYASKTFADIWNVSADIGYLQASNDVTADGYAHSWKFSEDTDAWTVGVRGEVLTKAGSVNIVPHVGLRYTALSTDGFEAGYVTDVDDQSIFQMPVGVTLSADFETNGWTIAPKFDLSVVPTFGDKDADLKLGITGVSATDDYSVRVIDSNPVQAQLGVNATNGDWGFGLSYKLGAGSDERMNNSFNATVRYAF